MTAETELVGGVGTVLLANRRRLRSDRESQPAKLHRLRAPQKHPAHRMSMSVSGASRLFDHSLHDVLIILSGAA